jgi:hypothetical protein
MIALGGILTLDNLRKRRVMVVNWCCNKAGRYLEVATYAEGGRKGVI